MPYLFAENSIAGENFNWGNNVRQVYTDLRKTLIKRNETKIYWFTSTYTPSHLRPITTHRSSDQFHKKIFFSKVKLHCKALM